MLKSKLSLSHFEYANKQITYHFWLCGLIILIPSQPALALSPLCCVLSGEATNITCIVFGLTWLGLEPTIYRNQSERVNHYITDVDLARSIETWIWDMIYSDIIEHGNNSSLCIIVPIPDKTLKFCFFPFFLSFISSFCSVFF